MRAAAIRAGAAARQRWPVAALGLLFLAVLVAIGNAAGPYLFRVATLQSEIATQVRITTGLILSAEGAARFDLLPSPRIKMSRLHISDPSGTVTINAEALRGEVRLLPLLVGRVELATATLEKPQLVIDLDGRPMPPDSLLGRAMHARPDMNVGGDRRLGAVTLVDGTVSFKSRTRHLPPVTDIDATVDWRDLGSPATLTGTARIAGTATDVAAYVEYPAALMRGARSAATLQLRSTPLDLTATGEVAGSTKPSFKGHVTGTAPSLGALIALLGGPPVLPAPFASATLDSDIGLALDRSGSVSLDLPSFHFGADGNAYEGTLAYQGTGTPLLSGTLAADRLTLRPFFAQLPAPLERDRTWSRHAIGPVAVPGALQLDIRISASHLAMPPFLVDDAALSVMTRDDRIEIGLNDGKAYGGALKGRLSIGGNDGLSLRGAGSIEGADAAALGWDLFGRQVAAGNLSGSASFETAGDSVAALIDHLGGWARGTASDGDLSGADLGLGLRALARSRPDEIRAALEAGRTPFQTLNFDLRLANGIATLGETSMHGRDATVSASGSIDLGRRTLDLHAVAATPEVATSGPRAHLPLDIGGTFDAPSVRPQASGR